LPKITIYQQNFAKILAKSYNIWW